MRTVRWLTLSALLAVVSIASADVESGPKAGEKIPKLEAFVAVGSDEGKTVDLSKNAAEGTVIYLFVAAPKFDRPMARMMREIDTKLPETNEKATVVAVWVGGETDPLKDRLPKIQMSLKFAKTSLAIFPGEASGPTGWGLNTDAHLTAVVVSKGKVVKSFAFTTVNETDAKDVLKAAK